MKLSIVIIDTNELHFLRPCLLSVFEQTKGIDFEVFVVDNVSTDGSREVLASEFPSVKVITNFEKLGFAAANNIAIPKTSGDFVLLLNPDTEVLDGAIQKTVAFMESHPDVGIAGCKLLYPDGTVQPSVRGFPTVFYSFLEASFLYLLLPKHSIMRKKGITRFDYSKSEEVDWLIGAYFMIRRSVIDKIGLLDEQFWIYGEEVDYCQIAKQAGFETWYISHAGIIHHYRGMIAYTLQAVVWLYVGHKLYVDKHYRGVRRFLITYLKYAGAVCRIIVYALVGCVTLNKQLFTKAHYFSVGLYKVLTERVEYVPGYTGKVEPWTKYL